MATNTSAQFAGDISRVLDRDVLPVAQRFLVGYQFADQITMERGAGTVWTATRFNRLPLPFAPLSEGVPPIGETMTISQVSGTALQWGDKVTWTDVAQETIQHSLATQAKKLLGMQMAETLERNTWVNLMTGTQVNYVNQRGARASLLAGDVLDPMTVNRTVVNLKNLGAPLFGGQKGETVKRDIEHNARGSSGQPMTHEHYVSVGSPLTLGDLANNPTVVSAWSYSDVTRLYINEMGYWRGMHFCESNMLPSWTGIAAVTASGPTTGGTFAAGTYAVQVTGADTQNQYESQIYQVQTGLVLTGSTSSITLTTPNTAGFTYSVYVSQAGSTTPVNLGLSTAGPTTGPYSGQATQIPPNTAVVVTNIGLFQVPPAAPATGVTVFPTFVFGEDYYACLKLENVQWTTLMEADKSDPNNQLRIIGWKLFEGFVIKNQQFGARIESTASNTGAFG